MLSTAAACSSRLDENDLHMIQSVNRYQLIVPLATLGFPPWGRGVSHQVNCSPANGPTSFITDHHLCIHKLIWRWSLCYFSHVLNIKSISSERPSHMLSPLSPEGLSDGTSGLMGRAKVSVSVATLKAFCCSLLLILERLPLHTFIQSKARPIYRLGQAQV